MSELQRRTDGTIATTDRQPGPIASLPTEWHAPVRWFYAFHSDLLKGTTGLSARFRMWIKDESLTLDEAREVMHRLMKPARVAGFQFAGQLLAALGEEVAEVLRTRKAREREAERRAAAERDRSEAANGSTVKSLLTRAWGERMTLDAKE